MSTKMSVSTRDELKRLTAGLDLERTVKEAFSPQPGSLASLRRVGPWGSELPAALEKPA